MVRGQGDRAGPQRAQPRHTGAVVRSRQGTLARLGALLFRRRVPGAATPQCARAGGASPVRSAPYLPSAPTAHPGGHGHSGAAARRRRARKGLAGQAAVVAGTALRPGLRKGCPRPGAGPSTGGFPPRVAHVPHALSARGCRGGARGKKKKEKKKKKAPGRRGGGRGKKEKKGKKGKRKREKKKKEKKKKGKGARVRAFVPAGGPPAPSPGAPLAADRAAANGPRGASKARPPPAQNTRGPGGERKGEEDRGERRRGENARGKEGRKSAKRGGWKEDGRLPPRRAASRRRVPRETSAKAGLPSADRSDKATLPLTGPVRASESSAKDPIPPVADTCDPRRRPARRGSAARGAPPPGWVLGRRAIAGPGRARLGRAGGAAAPRHGFRLRGVQPLPGGW